MADTTPLLTEARARHEAVRAAARGNKADAAYWTNLAMSMRAAQEVLWDQHKEALKETRE